jgi:hypothetical protein
MTDGGGGGGGGGGPTPADPIKGFVELDDFTYDKVVDGSRNVFVYAYTSWVGLRTPGCQIGYMDHAGCHQLMFVTARPTRVEPLPGGVRLVTRSILAAIN